MHLRRCCDYIPIFLFKSQVVFISVYRYDEANIRKNKMTKPTNPLDTHILAATTGEWQKIALVMSKVFDDPAVSSEDGLSKKIIARIEALVESGHLKSQGNIRRWRDASIKK